ncbi:hypothetical protein ACFV0L_29420 [Streptosporangium canum]|uniref:hypothetical protein n=1 Tax=Streptosporangium canum TaxID=324952 RepID=UPI00367A4FBA
MKGAVARHWPTNVVFDQIDLSGIVHADLTALLDADTASPQVLEVIEAKQVLADEDALRAHLLASMRALAAADGRPRPEAVNLEIQVWRGGYDLPPTASSSDYVAWCVLAATGSTYTESGAVALADPRAGCALVPMPGLPWGNPAMITAKAGAHMAAPGWLIHFVIPAEEAQSVIVAAASSV